MSSTDVVANSEIDLAYCRAALYSALALGFQPPNDDTLTRLLAAEGKASLIRAAAAFGSHHQDNLARRIEALPVLAANRNDSASQYRVLFGQAGRGQVPPYETEYGNEALFQQPQQLGDVMGFYRAFGLALKTASHERPDHISCELEFLMFLTAKEAYALEHDDPNMLAETRKAEKLFLRDHVARFVPSFALQLQRENGAGLYAQLGDLCLHVVAADCARLEIALGSSNLPLRPADDLRVPMACGNGAECPAMPGACAPEETE